MILFGQLSLLAALVCVGYAAFACLSGGLYAAPRLTRSGHFSLVAGMLSLTSVVSVLSVALLTHDFRFAYVAEYSSLTLPWQYAFSALWVGQAGSLLLWAWLVGAMTLVFRFWPWQRPQTLLDPATGVALAFLAFLLLIMVFAADPMRTTHALPREGAGLSPLLQHPSMLIHPPIVFVGYAAWLFPFALASAALLCRQVDSSWIRLARPWALFAWSVLGLGIVLGAQWAYEELGWGGYWGWDPVENGSLIPWITGTALLHGLMVWKHCGQLKKTSLALALATFALCNFATFLTRSGAFSSVHAFSHSPVGWMFLALLVVVVAGGGALLALRRRELAPVERPFILLSRETVILTSTVLLIVLAGVVLSGTLMGALSTFVVGRTILVGPGFYNRVLLPVGLLLLALTASAPLLRWRRPPTPLPGGLLAGMVVFAAIVPALAFASGLREPATLVVIGLAALVVAALIAGLWKDALAQAAGNFGQRVRLLMAQRRQLGGYVLHIGLALLAVGITGSAYGTRRYEAAMNEGEVVHWAGRDIHYTRLVQRTLPDKLVAEAELEIQAAGVTVATLLPARHLYLLQNQWTTEVAIHSSWQSDFYVILHSGEGGGRVTLSFIENPLMRWIWVGAGLMGCGSIIAIWPRRRRAAAAAAASAPSVKSPAALRRRAA